VTYRIISLSYYDEPMLTPCLHTYCKACILRSLETLARCPLCKHVLTKRQLNPMPSVADVVTNFQELQAAYEEMTGQGILQQPEQTWFSSMDS
jgi:Zinc finger, C3HC4 type (RING finger)